MHVRRHAGNIARNFYCATDSPFDGRIATLLCPLHSGDRANFRIPMRTHGVERNGDQQTGGSVRYRTASARIDCRPRHAASDKQRNRIFRDA
jgi:hypothetical protein